MGLLTEGYKLAMNHYRQLVLNQETINNIQKEVNKNDEVENNKPITDIKDNVNKNEDKFDNLVSDAIEKITGGQFYNVGGYSITIPALSNSKVQETIRANNIDGIVSMASKKYDIPEALIYKVIETESYFNTECISSAGATGLMQIMPFNNSYLGITDATDPYQNIMGGVKLLRQYIDMYNGDIKLGLAAYNAGPGNVNKYGGVPPFNETQNYIRKILGVEP